MIKKPGAGTFFNLIGSCVGRGLNPSAYLHCLFTRIAAEGTLAPDALTPVAYAAMTKPEPVAVQAA